MRVDSQTEKREDRALSDQGYQIIIFGLTVIVVVMATVMVTQIGGLLQETPQAGVTFSVNQAERSVTVTAVTMGNADGIVIRGFENYPTEDGGEPFIEEAGESARFRFDSNGTENKGTLAAVAVRGEVTESGDEPQYGERNVKLQVVEEGARGTVVQRRAYDFTRGR